MSRLFRSIAVAPLVLAGAVAAHSTIPSPAAPAASRTSQAPAGSLDGFVVELDKVAASLIQDLGVRGIAVAVIKDGSVVLERTYGFADVGRHIPVDTQTVFNAASVSKAVTAWGVLRLADQGRLDLDAPVFAKVSRWALPPSQWDPAGITARRLLSHTAGLSRPTVPMWGPDEVMPTIEAALSGRGHAYGDTRLTAQPGSQFSYSGGGYSILQLLVEETTGMSLIDYMDTEILQPLGMTHSAYGWTAPRLHEATPYSEFGDPIHAVRMVEVGAGGLHMTIGDFGRFAAANVASATAPAGRGVLSPARVAEMLTPATNTNGTRGLGPSVARTPAGRVLVGHDGGNPGWGAVYQVDPKTRDGIAVLVNRSWGYQAYTPILCTWRNWSRDGGEPERCGRDQTAVLLHTIMVRGLDAGRKRFDEVRAAAPAALGDQAMGRLARQFTINRRGDVALELLKWNVEAWPGSAVAHELLGDALLSTGDTAGARARFTEVIRLNPKNTTAAEKLARLPARELGDSVGRS